MSIYEPLTPVQVEQQMGEALSQVKASAQAMKQAREAFAASKRAHTIRLAVARQSDSGSRADREDRALIDNEASWLAMDTADIAMRYSQDLRDDAEKSLSALQTVSKLILQAYNVGTR